MHGRDFTCTAPVQLTRHLPSYSAMSGSEPSSREKRSSIVHNALSFSLHDTLTKLESSDNYAATELSKLLLDVVGRHVCGFKRNAQISYRLVGRARDICNEINRLFTKIQSDTDLASIWGSYDNATSAIDVLEE